MSFVTTRSRSSLIQTVFVAVSVVASLAWAAAMLPVVSQAFKSAIGAVSLPHPLAVVLRHLPILFPLHMAAAAGALLLVPLAFASRRMPSVHRWIGRAAALCILGGGMASLAVAWRSVATLPARAGFFCQGLVWLGLAASGVLAIRRKQRAQHVRFMTATAIVTVSPVLLRFLLHGAVMARLPFNRTYALLAWGVWLVPLAAYGIISVGLIMRRRSCQLDGARQLAAPTYLKSTVIG
jgi:hypothetical protein